MDKTRFKAVITAEGIDTPRWVPAPAGQPLEIARAAVVSRLGFPVFVKPAAGGGSLGAGIAQDAAGVRRPADRGRPVRVLRRRGVPGGNAGDGGSRGYRRGAHPAAGAHRVHRPRLGARRRASGTRQAHLAAARQPVLAAFAGCFLLHDRLRRSPPHEGAPRDGPERLLSILRYTTEAGGRLSRPSDVDRRQRLDSRPPRPRRARQRPGAVVCSGESPR